MSGEVAEPSRSLEKAVMNISYKVGSGKVLKIEKWRYTS